MVRLILVMHEPLGHAFAQCAAHILGHEPDLLIFDVEADESPDECTTRLERLLEAWPTDGVLILCDIYGATPFNIAARVTRKLNQEGRQIALITGTNLCMVLKALTDKQENPEKLSAIVREGALKGIIRADDFD